MALSKIKIAKAEKRKNTKTNQDFISYKTIDPKTGKLIDLRFNKTVKNVPEERCYILVPEDKWNINRTGEWPICYVKEIARVEPIVNDNSNEPKFETVDDTTPF